MPVLIAAIGALGLAVGSFLNVVAYRVPAGLSLVSPGSHCPDCERPVRHRHNVPVLGWLALRGRCYDCSSRISAQYPLVEAATGLLFVVTVVQLAHLDRLVSAPAYLYLAAAGTALTLIDARTHRLPDRIVLPSYPVLLGLLTVTSAVTGDWSALVRGLVGAALSLAVYLLMWLVYPGGMGFGDVKLAGLVGMALAYLSWPALAVGTFAAFLLGGIVGTVLLVTTERSRRSRLAFGPFMVAGVWVALLLAQPIAASYLRLISPA